MIKTVEILKQHGLSKAQIIKLTGISGSTLRNLDKNGTELSPRLREEMIALMTKFVDDIISSLNSN